MLQESTQRNFFSGGERAIEYKFLKWLSRLICFLPLKFCLALGRGLANFLWFVLPPKRKRIATENVRRCLNVSSDDADRIAKAGSVQLGSIFVEVLALPKLKKIMRDYVKIDGLELLTDYIASTGRGGVIMTCHSDNWELMGGAFAQNGIPLVGVAKKQRSDGADKFICEYRELVGMHVTYRNDVREMYKLLDEGKFIGLIMDQDVGRTDGVVVKFFNQATNFVTGAASMSRFRKIPIFPAFMHKNSDGTHTLKVSPPLYVERTKDKHADLKLMTQRLATLIEEHIKNFPEEWFWLHDRWKSMRVEFTPEEVEQFNRELKIS